MNSPHKLSLASVVFINLNIMIGAGIFVNTVLLAKNAGPFGFLAYLCVGVLILPLILSMAMLSKLHKGGSFYDYGLSISYFGATLTSLVYFFAKLSSCSLAIHVCMTLLKTIIEPLAHYNTIALDIFLLGCFTGCNMLNIKAGNRIQLFFLLSKFIPILIVIGVGLCCFFHAEYFLHTTLQPLGIATSIPFVVYAFAGFEASCSLNRLLENPEKDGPLAMIIAFTLGVMIVSLFQGILYGILGPNLALLNTYQSVFPALIQFFPHSIHTIAHHLLHFGIAASVLGTAYGIMYSNAWNLFELSKRKQGLLFDTISTLNRQGIPFMCIFLETIMIIIYLVGSGGNQIVLQQIAALGNTCAYSLCMLGLFIKQKNAQQSLILPSLGIISCLILFATFLVNFAKYGFVPSLCFLCFVTIMSALASLPYFNQHQRT